MKVDASAGMGRWASPLLWVRKGFRLGAASSTAPTGAEKGPVPSTCYSKTKKGSKSISIVISKEAK